MAMLSPETLPKVGSKQACVCRPVITNASSKKLANNKNWLFESFHGNNVRVAAAQIGFFWGVLSRLAQFSTAMKSPTPLL
jgi:hypothetical protein